MVEILNVHTEHVIPIKTLFDVLKEVLTDVIIKFIADKVVVTGKKKEKTEKSNKKPYKKKNESESESDSESEDEADVKDDKKKPKSGGGGIRILSVNSDKTVMIVLKLESEQFYRFKCTVPELSIGVNLNTFIKLIKPVYKDGTLTLQYDDNNREILNIVMENPEKTKKKINELKLLDLDDKHIQVPITTFDAVITMPSAEFHTLCRENHGIADYIDIKCTPRNIIFTCKGECANSSTTYNVGEKTDISIRFVASENNKANVVQGIFALKDVVLFNKCAGLCDEIEIYMKNDYPLVINYAIATLGKLIICIAPKRKKSEEEYNDDTDEEEEDDDKVYATNDKLKYKNVAEDSSSDEDGDDD